MLNRCHLREPLILFTCKILSCPRYSPALKIGTPPSSIFFSPPRTIPTNLRHHSYILVTMHAIHGFSALLSPSELEILKKPSGFISAISDEPVELHTTHTPEFLSLTESYGLWRNSKYGKNVIIGVVDSGVWPEHPSFNDRGMTRDIPDKWRGSCQHGREF